MTNPWPIVPLGNVLKQRKEFVRIDDGSLYKRARVQLRAKGIVQRDQVPGAIIKTKKQQICHAGEFLVAEIDAKVGGFGIVPEFLEGAIVSSHYFLFVVDERQLDQKFLDYFIRTLAFRNQVEAQGSTNYAAIRPADVLRYQMPLPALSEQRRVVSRIDTLSNHVSEARNLGIAAAKEASQLCGSIMRSDKHAQLVPMRELVRLRSPDVTVEPTEIYQFAGVYSFGRGVFRSQAKSGSQFAYPKLTRIRSGDFTYPKLMAWEGALGIVPPECDGCVVSTEFPVFDVIEERVLPEVLDTYFRTPAIWPELSGASTGTNVRRRRLNPTDFLNYKLPLPSRSVQQQVRKVKAELREVERLRERATIELDALMPSILSKAFAGQLL